MIIGAKTIISCLIFVVTTARFRFLTRHLFCAAFNNIRYCPNTVKMKYKTIMDIIESRSASENLSMTAISPPQTTLLATPEIGEVSTDEESKMEGISFENEPETGDDQSNDEQDSEDWEMSPADCVEAVLPANQEIFRWEVECDIEQLLAKHLCQNLKKLHSFIGNVGDFRADIEKAIVRPVYALNATEFENHNKVVQPSDIGERLLNFLRLVQLESVTWEKPKIAIKVEDLKYKASMKRDFPNAKKKNKAQQVARVKNTNAARMSRAKNVVYENMLERTAVDKTMKNINLKRQLACMMAYLKMSQKLLGKQSDFKKDWEANLQNEFYDKNFSHNQDVEKTFLQKLENDESN